MERNFLAFDIEIAKELPEGSPDWKVYCPFGISCAATQPMIDRAQPSLWYSRNGINGYAPQMSQQDLKSLVDYLVDMVEAGYTILTWNGLGFDFDILAEESRMFEKCKALALSHVDMMFHFFCKQGYTVSLDSAAKGMNLPGKPEGIIGALAPRLWREGEYEKVLNYVAQDALITMRVAIVSQGRGYMRWVTQKGYVRSIPIPSGWLIVREALELPEPDTSWMTDPWPHSKFTSWLI